MKKFLSKLFNSRNSEVEAHLVLVTAGACVFIGLAIYHTIILHSNFDPENYGSGFGYLMAGGGAASWGQGMQRKAQEGTGNESAQ